MKLQSSKLLATFLATALSSSCAIANIPSKGNDEIYTSTDIVIKLPLLFNDYDKLIKLTNKADYIYPGSFDITPNGDIYIQYVYQPKNKNNVIVKYSKSGNYIGYFLVSNGGKGIAGEGLHISESEGSTTAAVSAPDGQLQYYDISNQYLNKSAPLINSIDLDIYNEFSINGDAILVEKNNDNHSVENPRNELLYYKSKDYRPKDIIQEVNYSGYIVANAVSNATDFNKRQGLALGKNYFIASYGAFYNPHSKETNNTYQGIRSFDMDGKLINEKIFPPADFISFLMKNKMPASRIENEGAIISHNGNEIYSIYIYSDRNHPGIAKKEGIVIMRDNVHDMIKRP